MTDQENWRDDVDEIITDAMMGFKPIGNVNEDDALWQMAGYIRLRLTLTGHLGEPASGRAGEADRAEPPADARHKP